MPHITTLLAVQLAACGAHGRARGRARRANATVPRAAFGGDPAPDPACRRDAYPDKYLVLLTAREQMNKNVAVVAEAAAYARAAGRTFVEPVYCRSRVRPPFDGPGAVGAAFARAVGEIAALRQRERIDSPLVGRTAQGFDADQFACDEGKAALSAARDVREMCDVVPTITAAAFVARLAAAGPALRDDFVLLGPKHTKHGLRRGAAAVTNNAVVYLWGMPRHISNADVATGACVARPCYGMTFGPATDLAEKVERVAAAARPYACLNWRSEAVSMQFWPYCTQVLVDTIQEAWRAEGFEGGRTIITSDVYGATSWTWGLPWWGSRTPAKPGVWKESWVKAVPHLKKAVRELLEESLERINANASAAATFLAHQNLRGSEAAAAEQLLCARADILVMCARKNGCACGRGLDSGFVAAIHAHRGASGRSTRMNEKGGVWNYLEKPGWDFQASSRVPLAGRATAPIASYVTGDVVPWKARPRNATARRNATGLTGVRRIPRSGRRRRPRDASAGVVGPA